MDKNRANFHVSYSTELTYKQPYYLCSAKITRSRIKDDGKIDYDTESFQCTEYTSYGLAKHASLLGNDEPYASIIVPVTEYEK